MPTLIWFDIWEDLLLFSVFWLQLFSPTRWNSRIDKSHGLTLNYGEHFALKFYFFRYNFFHTIPAQANHAKCFCHIFFMYSSVQPDWVVWLVFQRHYDDQVSNFYIKPVVTHSMYPDSIKPVHSVFAQIIPSDPERIRWQGGELHSLIHLLFVHHIPWCTMCTMCTLQLLKVFLISDQEINHALYWHLRIMPSPVCFLCITVT